MATRLPTPGARLIAVLLCLLLLCVCGKAGLVPKKGQPISAGTDLLASYAAGHLVLEGRAAQMYDRSTMSAAEETVMRQARIVGDSRFLPWMNPPFAALPFAPLAILPYRAAALTWLAVNIGLVGCCLMLLRGMMPAQFPLSRIILLWLAICLSMPFWQAMFAQQNTFVSLALICLVARFWLAGRGFWAGACAGLMLFKPQLAMVIAATLGISLGAEAVVGFGAAAIALLSITAVALPGTLTAYLHQLPPTIRWLQMELPYNWGRQTTLQGFWRLVIQGHAVGPTAGLAKMLGWLGMAAFGIPLAIAAWRTRGGGAADRRRLIAAAIVATPLIAPYYMDYDLLLLAVAAVLTIGRAEAEPPRSGGLMEKRIGVGWIGVAIALYLNPFFAAEGRWDVAVIAIAAMAVLLIRRVFTQLPRVTAGDRPCPAAPASALSR